MRPKRSWTPRPTGSPFPIHPLADSAESLRAEIAKLKICLVIVDSQSQAAGSIGQGDPAIRVRELVRTVNSFSVTTLLISQVSKVESRYQGTREPCGSRHLSYLADDTWELRATSDPENRRLTTVLHHRKHRGPWHPPLAFTADFPDEGVVRLTDAPVPDDIETSGRTQQHRSDRPPAGQQAAQVAIIAQLGEATPTQVAQYLRPKEAGKPTRLPARLARTGWIRQIRPGGRGGRGADEPLYGPTPVEEDGEEEAGRTE